MVNINGNYREKWIHKLICILKKAIRLYARKPKAWF